MKKKTIVSIIIIFVLLLIAGGVFWWQKDEIESFLEQRELEKMVALSKDYVIAENADEKFIINERDGLKIKIPAKWEAEIGLDMFGMESEENVTLYSKDFSYRPPSGCLIEIQISRLQKREIREYNGDFEIFPYEGVEEVKEMINFYKQAELGGKEGIKIISIDRNEALQETKMLEEDIGEQVSIKVPTENRVYIFESILFSDDCDKEFNKFLETISIQ